MKRLFFISMLFSLGVACNKNEEIVTPKDSANEEKVEKIDEFQTPGDKVVTATEALTRAEEILSRFQTRSTPRVVKSCEYFVAKPATRSLADTIEVAFHLINYEDNAGFAMVAADERATDIYAYSDEGELTPEILEGHPGMSIFLDGAIDHYQAEVRGLIPSPEPWPEDDPIGPVDPTRPSDIIKLPMELLNGKFYFCKTEEVFISTDPLTPFYWDQFYPYNHFCTPYVTGCGPTAMGKIMAYHRHPASFNGHTYNWDMITANERHTSLSDATMMISRLVCDIGQDQPRIEYRTSDDGGTSTYFSENRETFLHFGYSCSTVMDFSSSLVVNNIDNRKPVWVGGQETLGSSGHIWHIDAYQDNRIIKTYYETTPPYNVYHKNIYHSYSYRCVWGWDTLYYTYCLSNAFNGYARDVKMICGITPNN